jgi:predicted porin
MAETTIYGQMNLSVDDVSNGAVANSTSALALSSNTSRLGFKGSEDLGDGLSAIWQIESQINVTGGGAGSSGTVLAGTSANNGNNAVGSVLASRDTFVGLSSSSMGTVLGGKHDTPYKMATRGYDLFADGIADTGHLSNRSLHPRSPWAAWGEYRVASQPTTGSMSVAVSLCCYRHVGVLRF